MRNTKVIKLQGFIRFQDYVWALNVAGTFAETYPERKGIRDGVVYVNEGLALAYSYRTDKDTIVCKNIKAETEVKP